MIASLKVVLDNSTKQLSTNYLAFFYISYYTIKELIIQILVPVQITSWNRKEKSNQENYNQQTLTNWG